jgi:hypothetical protein
VFRTRSRTQPVIVRDLRLEFDRMPEGLKPGAPVRVRLEPSRAVAGVAP